MKASATIFALLMILVAETAAAMVAKAAFAQQSQQPSTANNSPSNHPARIVRRTKYSDLPEAVPASMAVELERVKREVATQIASHPGQSATVYRGTAQKSSLIMSSALHTRIPATTYWMLATRLKIERP